MKKLHACVLEAKDLPPISKDAVGLPDAYAKLRVGRSEARTRTVRGSLGPVWNEEFVFEVDTEQVLLQVWVFYEGKGAWEEEEYFLGHVYVQVRSANGDGEQILLPPTWFSLQSDGNDHCNAKDCGKILLTLLHGRSDNFIICSSPRLVLYNSTCVGQLEEPAVAPSNILEDTNCLTITNTDTATPVVEETLNASEETMRGDSRNHDLLELSDTISNEDIKKVDTSSTSHFEEAIGIMQSRHATEMPDDLQGGILLNQTYKAEPKDVNIILFGPNSQFMSALVEQQGTTEYNEGPWIWKDTDKSCLTRSVTCTRPASKLVKAVKATEEQIYLKADGKIFAVLVNVSTPDVPYGNCFRVDLLFKIMPGPQLSAGEESSHVVISWNINFTHSTIMKSVIEGGTRQGLKESYETFSAVLAQFVKPANSDEHILDKDHLLAPLQDEHQSDWELAIEYLCNFTVIFTIFMALYVLLHILLSAPGTIQGLEFKGLDLPDTFGELIASGILVLQGERVFNMVAHFVKARLQRGNDHGIKAQGDGWLVTVALIEGSNIPTVASSGFLDPYVVFSCSGQMRTSSVQLQTRDPQWNEILEFDAMQEPPSVLDVDVFDFDGPFDQAVSLCHAKINFLKHTAEDLADIWVLLDGKLPHTFHSSKLHLRIFLDNTKGSEAIGEYLTKMGKEVGKKLCLQSPHRNLAFQRLFGLPTDEFLINDFSCCLKRKFPLQGRLFLSARIVGFHANFFGHKTNFFLLWEDIEDIRAVSPSFSTVGSPALLMVLRSGRGYDARHGAKSQDKQGRLKFQFQSFVSFNSASRTIMGLWRTKTPNAEQIAKLDEDQYDQCGKSCQIVKLEDENQDQSGNSGRLEDGEYILGSDGTRISKAFSMELSIHVEPLMEIFSGGKLEKKIMEKVGCLNYSVTRWEALGSDHVYKRHVSYKFNRQISIFGGEVSSIQHKAPNVYHNGWSVDEVMTLHNVPFGDHFRVGLKYIMIETSATDSTKSQCDTSLGVTWLKNTKFKKRITKNICNKLTHRSREIFELAEREILSSSQSQ